MKAFPKRTNRNRGGFTLLETVVSMAVMTLIMAVSIKTLLTIYETTEDLTEVHRAHNQSRMFWYACDTAFGSLTKESDVAFDFVQKGERYDTFLTIGDTPGAFQLDFHRFKKVDQVLLAAQHRPDGWLRVGVYYLSNDEYRREKELEFSGLTNYPYIELIPKAQQFSWRFFNSRTREWETTISQFSPSMIELKIARLGETHPESSVFEIQ